MDKFRNLFIFASILLLTILSNGCNEAQSSQSTVVRIGSFFTALDYAPFIIAKNNGWFEEAFNKKGVKIEYKTFQTLPTLNEAIATNNIDVLFEAEPPAIVGRAAGIDVKIKDISCSINLGILVPSESSVTNVSDLKGKKIALLAGTGVHYGVLKILEDNGVMKSEVEIVDMLPPDAKSAFETGVVDAWAVWSPFIDQEIISGKGRLLPDDSFQIQSIMVVRGKFLAEKPELFTIVKQVFDRAQAWMENNPEEAMKIVAKELDLSFDVVQMAWPRHIWKAEITPSIVDDIQNKADFLFEEKFIENKVNAKTELFTTYGAESK